MTAGPLAVDGDLFPGFHRCKVCGATYRTPDCPVCADREVRARTAASVAQAQGVKLPPPVAKKPRSYDPCQFIKRNGDPCHSPANLSGYCAWHDPERRR